MEGSDSGLFLLVRGFISGSGGGESGRDFPVGMVKKSQGAGFSLSGHRCKFSK